MVSSVGLALARTRAFGRGAVQPGTERTLTSSIALSRPNPSFCWCKSENGESCDQGVRVCL